MKVRVYDKNSDSYFKSEVYAIINHGYYEKYLVLTPEHMGNEFRFYEYIDKTQDDPFVVLVNVILQQWPVDWITKESQSTNEKIEEYQNVLCDDIRFVSYSGFSWLFDDVKTLSALIKGKSIPLKGSVFEDKLYSDMNDDKWHYVETQEDITFLMNETAGFHDSIINEVSYISGGFVDSEKVMHLADSKRIAIKMDSQLSDNVELIFDGVTMMNIRPCKENCLNYIDGASMFIENETIVFYDGQREHIENDYDGNMICAYGCKWRFRNEES